MKYFFRPMLLWSAPLALVQFLLLTMAISLVGCSQKTISPVEPLKPNSLDKFDVACVKVEDGGKRESLANKLQKETISLITRGNLFKKIGPCDELGDTESLKIKMSIIDYTLPSVALEVAQLAVARGVISEAKAEMIFKVDFFDVDTKLGTYAGSVDSKRDIPLYNDKSASLDYERMTALSAAEVTERLVNAQKSYNIASCPGLSGDPRQYIRKIILEMGIDEKEIVSNKNFVQYTTSRKLIFSEITGASSRKKRSIYYITINTIGAERTRHGFKTKDGNLANNVITSLECLARLPSVNPNTATELAERKEDNDAFDDTIYDKEGFPEDKGVNPGQLKDSRRKGIIFLSTGVGVLAGSIVFFRMQHDKNRRIEIDTVPPEALKALSIVGVSLGSVLTIAGIKYLLYPSVDRGANNAAVDINADFYVSPHNGSMAPMLTFGKSW